MTAAAGQPQGGLHLLRIRPTGTHKSLWVTIYCTGTRSSQRSMSRLLEIIKLADRPIRGAALVPMYRYPLDGHARDLRGRLCLLLGRERGGAYRGKLNFFGGKVDVGEGPMHALMREVAEELCIKLTPENIDTCMVDTQLLPRRTWLGNEYFTLLVFVHVTGIRRKVWSDIQAQRRRQHAPRSQLEMSEVSHIPVEDILTRQDVSTYVQENVLHINNAMQLLTDDNLVTFKALQTVLRPDRVDLAK